MAQADRQNGAGAYTATKTTAYAVKRPYWDWGYVYTVHGILKIVEAVLDFICFICIMAGPLQYFPEAGWPQFVTIVSFAVTTILLIMYMLHVIEMLHAIPWLIVEFVYGVLWTVFYLAAGIILARDAAAAKRMFLLHGDAWIAAAELVYYFLFAVFYLVGFGLLMSVISQGYKVPEFTAGGVFAFILMVVYAADAVLKFIAWQNGEVAQGAASRRPATIVYETSTSTGNLPP